MRNPLEKEIERKLKVLIEGKFRGKCLKWVSPGWSGVPDRIILLPGGKVYFAELKRPSGKVDPLQIWWRRQLEGLGFTVWHVYSLEDINRIGEILNATNKDTT